MCIFIFYPSLATSQMISTATHTFGPNYIQLMWTWPKYFPEEYKLKYVCVMSNPSGNLSSSMDIIKTMTRFLTSDSCSIKISDLRPNTMCFLNLIAVYNPASSDTGIVITVTTSKLPLISCYWIIEVTNLHLQLVDLQME